MKKNKNSNTYNMIENNELVEEDRETVESPSLHLVGGKPKKAPIYSRRKTGTKSPGNRKELKRCGGYTSRTNSTWRALPSFCRELEWNVSLPFLNRSRSNCTVRDLKFKQRWAMVSPILPAPLYFPNPLQPVRFRALHESRHIQLLPGVLPVQTHLTLRFFRQS